MQDGTGGPGNTFDYWNNETKKIELEQLNFE